MPNLNVLDATLERHDSNARAKYNVMPSSDVELFMCQIKPNANELKQRT